MCNISRIPILRNGVSQNPLVAEIVEVSSGTAREPHALLVVVQVVSSPFETCESCEPGEFCGSCGAFASHSLHLALSTLTAQLYALLLCRHGLVDCRYEF